MLKYDILLGWTVAEENTTSFWIDKVDEVIDYMDKLMNHKDYYILMIYINIER